MKKLLNYLPNYLSISKYVLGIFLLAFGVAFIVKSRLGAAPWDLLAISLSSITSLTIGTWQVIFNVSMIVLTTLIITQKINLICLIPGVILGIMIDVSLWGVSFFEIPAYFCLLIGIFLSGAGIALYVNQNLSANAIDNFTFQCHKKYCISLDFSKIITDAIPVIFLLLFFIKNLTLITLGIYLFVPIAIKFWAHCFRKIGLI